MDSKQIEAVYHLTSMQQRIPSQTVDESASDSDLTQVTCTMHGLLDQDAFARAWQSVLDRHVALRTAFVWQAVDQPLHVVDRQVRLSLERHDWRASPPNEHAEHLEQMIMADRRRGFDLSKAPLLRLTLIRVADNVHHCICNQHHLLLDDWCATSIIKEVLDCYQVLTQGQALQLPTPQPYQEYIAWVQQQDLAQAEGFWRDKLKGFTRATPLIVDTGFQATIQPGQRYDEQALRLSPTTTGQLHLLAQQLQITLNTVVQGAWGLLLSRYSDEDDIVFGANVSARSPAVPSVESMLGVFSAMLPVRLMIEPSMRLIDWLKELQLQQVEMQRYVYSPLAEIQGWSDVPREQPLFESALVFESGPIGAALRQLQGNLTIDDVRLVSGRTGYPLTIFVVPEEQLALRIVYDCRRFEAVTITQMLDHLQGVLEALVNNPGQCIADLDLIRRHTIALSATFTAEPIAETLAFWMRQLDLPSDIQFAPYNQVFQQLLDPRSLLAQNQHGTNVVLVGFEDWLRFASDAQAHGVADVSANVDDLIAALKAATARHATRYLICLCPASPDLDPDQAAHFQQQEVRLTTELASVSSIYVVSSADLLTTYPVDAYYDPHGDALGHVPFTPELYIALGTVIARRIHAFMLMPYKVIAVDCDHTLWQGVCGEDGVQGILIDAPRKALQRFMVRQQAAGPLLCMASKNNEADVFEVFAQHPDMVLSRDHFTSWRINWLPKSENIKALAQELQLGLDSFIFIDDDALECAEVQTNCPEVLTLRLPQAAQALPDFLEHLWVFDRLKVTLEDRQRGAAYRQNVERERVRHTALTFDDFIASLELKVQIAELKPQQLPRVAQLTQRTNQFNVTGIRRSESEIQQLCQSGGVECLVVEVSDRFGDYGLVGMMLVEPRDDALLVDTLLLSCRALGRGVEHRMLNHLGMIAQQRGLSYVDIPLMPTQKNAPAQSFLERSAPHSAQQHGAGSRFRFTATAAATLTHSATSTQAEPTPPQAGHAAPAAARSATGKRVIAARMHRIATELQRVDQIRAVMSAQTRQHRPELATSYEAPRTPLEELLAALWSQVLDVERVGRHDNFFALGGHSLSATQLLARVRATFDRALPLRALFAAPTIAAFAATLQAQDTPAVLAAPPLQPRPSDQPVPLSFAQQRLWFLNQLAPDSSAYNVSTMMRLTGHVHDAALEQSLQEIARRHEMLRTTFVVVDEQPIQHIAPTIAITLLRIDLQPLDRSEQETRIQQLAIEDSLQPFDLGKGPLLRAALIRLSEREHMLLCNMHHIISDGWSQGVLVRELGTLYGSYAAGQASPLMPLPVQYADYTLWQRAWLQGRVLETQLAYWREHLHEPLAVLSLPTDRPRPSVQTEHGATYRFTIPEALTSKLVALSLRDGVTLFMTLLAGFKVVLARYSGQSDVVVGSPIAGRTHTETEGLIGFFVNTLVLRTNLAGNPSFRELLQRVRDVTLNAYAHSDTPFEKIVEDLQPQRDLSRTPIFQVLFVLQNTPQPLLDLPGLTLELQDIDHQMTPFDMSLSVRQQAQHLTGVLEYNTDLFDASTVQRMMDHLLVVLTSVVSNAEQRIATISLLTDAERQHMLSGATTATTTYPADLCIHTLIAQQAALRPEAVAVVFEDQRLTYRELNRRANQLAHLLQARGVGPETRVGLCMERCTDLMIGLLAILKAGGAYIPLDPAYPGERLAFMLEDAQANLILSQQRLLDHLPAHAAEIMCLDRDWDVISQQPAVEPISTVGPGNLAYVIYTSGSTGQPKGVMVQHRSLVAFTLMVGRAYTIDANDRMLQFTSLSWDTSVEEIFPCLAHGATLVLRPATMLDSMTTFVRTCDLAGVTVLNLPTALWHILTTSLTQDHLTLPATLRLVIIGGERALPDHIAAWRMHVGSSVRLLNTYGLAETTVEVSMCEVSNAETDACNLREVSIGRPFDAVCVYLLDANLQPVPIGVPGEIYVSGGNLARGYLGRPTLTAERFMPDPFSHSPGKHMYRTGDMGRYRADGQLEFIGRADHQVKIRGHRVELGEIESALIQHPQVREAVVVVRDTGASGGASSDKQLVAYIVPDTAQTLSVGADHQLSVTDVQVFLRQMMPAYMIPAAFVFLEHIPLTPGGKLNRRALPDPECARAAARVLPHDALELRLANIWEDLLAICPVGITDNFFDIGGHSLLAVRLQTHIEQQFGQQLTLTMLFQHPTIEQLASLLRQPTTVQAWSPMVALQTDGTRPPLFCAHGGDGSALSFIAFARSLGPSQPCYSFQAAGFEGEQPPCDSIPHMAAHYITALREIQPHGPYHLAGWSIGGVIAFEMAEQLAHQGQTVAPVLLLDSRADLYFDPKHRPPLDDTSVLIEFLQEMASATGQKFGEVPQALASLEPEALKARLLHEARRAQILPADVGLAQVRHRLAVFQANLRALEHYVPPIGRQPLTVVRAMEQQNGADHDPSLGWAGRTSEDITIIEVPGTHYTMLAPPHVTVLAERLQSCLDLVRAIGDRW